MENINSKFRDGAGTIEISRKDSMLLERFKILGKVSSNEKMMAEEIKLKYFAMAIAKLLKFSEVRYILKTKISIKFDGDYNVLWNQIKGDKIGDISMRELVNSRFSPKAINLISIDKIESVSRLQIAIPKIFEKWDGERLLLVTYTPLTMNDIEVETLEAYDENLKVHILSGKMLPDEPVIVVGKNERVDENGMLKEYSIYRQLHDVPYEREFKRDSMLEESNKKQIKEKEGALSLNNKISKRLTTVGMIWLEHFYTTDDHEPWFQGDAEFKALWLSDLGISSQGRITWSGKKNQWYQPHLGMYVYGYEVGKYVVVDFWEEDGSEQNTNINLQISFIGAGGTSVTITGSQGVNSSDDHMGGPRQFSTESFPINPDQNSITNYYTTGCVNFIPWWNHEVCAWIPSIPFYTTGTTVVESDDWDVAGSDGPDKAYYFYLEKSLPIRITTCGSITNYDTKVEIFRAGKISTGIWNDDVPSCTAASVNPPSYASRVPAVNNPPQILPPGHYWLIVDGYAGAKGQFQLEVLNY